jgi:N-ethylmaleimide reductase
MKLLQPTTLGLLSLPNRVVMAPMTRSRAGEGNVPQPINAVYYAQRAGAGLIVTEATQISPVAAGYPFTPGIHSEAQIEGWKRVTDAIHAAGGRVFLQLWHVGRVAHPLNTGGLEPVAPSAIAIEGAQMFTPQGPKDYPTPRALTLDEIAETVQDFRRATANAKRAGFDGVEVHGANGYLIDQFLQSGTNRRDDRYGGSLENRLRFMNEVVDAVVDEWEPGRVGIRLSPGGSFNDMHDDDPVATWTAAAQALAGRGLAYLHEVRSELPGGVGSTQLLREHFDGPLMSAGGYDRESGAEAVQSGAVDLVAYARYYLANPDLPERFLLDAPTNEWDDSTFYGGGAEGYTDYPFMDRDGAYQTAPEGLPMA